MIRRACILAICLGILGVCTSQCVMGQPWITRYPDNHIKFGLVSPDNCEPSISLSDGSTTKQIVYDAKNQYTNQALTYSRYAYFFTASVKPGTTYTWSYETAKSKLGPFKFRLRSAEDASSSRYLWTADMDISDNSRPTVAALVNNLDLTKYDGYMHGGDFAYDINDDDGMKGDRYFESLGSVTASVPFMPIAGNHENYDNGRLFDYRFKMPSSTDNNLWHVVQHDTLFLFVNYDMMLTWKGMSMTDAVMKIKSIFDENSAVQWRVVVSHRPDYCGDLETVDCFVNIYALKAIDDLYRKYKVDILMQSHEHFYERLKVIDSQLNIDQSCYKAGKAGIQAIYDRCSHPVTVINGCAGNEEIFPTNVTTNGFSELHISGVQCFAEVAIERGSLSIAVRSSADFSEIDNFKLLKDVQPQSSKAYLTYYIIGGLIVTIVFSLLLFKASPSSKDRPDGFTECDLVNNKLDIN